MRTNYVHYGSPQFRILWDKQIEELHFATLQILERTGVAFECQEAIDILGNAGADVSNPDSVKIPSYMVEQALRTAPPTRSCPFPHTPTHSDQPLATSPVDRVVR